MAWNRDRTTIGLPSASVPLLVEIISPFFHSALAVAKRVRYTSRDVIAQCRPEASNTRSACDSDDGFPEASTMRSSSSIPKPSNAFQAFHVPNRRGLP
jgi:hypothetical protein